MSDREIMELWTRLLRFDNPMKPHPAVLLAREVERRTAGGAA